MDLSQEAADKIHWWHTMTLPTGVVTKGHHDPAASYPTLHLPSTLHGLRCADIGAWDGAFSFEMYRRGGNVTAFDRHVWRETGTPMHHGSPTGKRGFEFANASWGNPVRSIEVDPLELAIAMYDHDLEPFDFVLFIGVLYHMRHPLLALENVARLTKTTAIIETHLNNLDHPHPSMSFYEGAQLNNDPTNWVGPNPQAVCAMTRAAGFRACRAVWQSGSRGVFHAEK